MKVNINIDENLVEDRAEFYLQEMTDKITICHGIHSYLHLYRP